MNALLDTLITAAGTLIALILMGRIIVRVTLDIKGMDITAKVPIILSTFFRSHNRQQTLTSAVLDIQIIAV